MTTKLPVYEAKILRYDDTGIFALSFVDCPANEKNFVALRAARPVKMSTDKVKQILTGAVLIPDQLIYRNNGLELGLPHAEYNLKFTAADIEQIAHKLMRSGIALSSTTHQHAGPLADNYLVECWLVQDPKNDKANALGLGELPKGTLVASYKVGNAGYWRREVMTGKVNGFSIEGLFNFKNVTMAKQTTPPAKTVGDVKLSTIGKFLSAIGVPVLMADDLAPVIQKDATGSGDPVLVFELQDGGEIDVDIDGYCTMAADGSQAPAGDQALADGNFITIDDAGMLVTTTDTPDATAAAAPAAALMAKQREAAKKNAIAMLAKINTPDKKIAALKAQIALLEKEPSAAKAKPTATPAKGNVALMEMDPKDMNFTQRAAYALALRRQREEGKDDE